MVLVFMAYRGKVVHVNWFEKYILIADRPQQTHRSPIGETLFEISVHLGIGYFFTSLGVWLWGFTGLSRWWVLGPAISGALAFAIYSDWSLLTNWSHLHKDKDGHPSDWLQRDFYVDLATKVLGPTLAIWV